MAQLPSEPLPFRQVHLDFHTSEEIPGIGAAFDPDAFADTLVRAHVQSINIFARGHHGWLYYDTPGFPERRHPHLKTDLLRQQIEACHARGIKTPIYITVQADYYTSMRHPEWRIIEADGSLAGEPPYEAGFWTRLCLNTPYVDWLKTLCDEIAAELPVDGWWFDIVDANDCSCWHCQQDMLALDMDPANAADRYAFARQVVERFQRDMTAYCQGLVPGSLVFYNAGHVGPRTRHRLDTYTHLELESLPSGGWGYLHFPIAARYARKLGIDFLGMTGKFQTSWGDFHSFKNQAALEFECFNMLALNAKCCVGDQLPPNGRICPHTYDLIGRVYEQVEAKEPWCVAAEPVTEIGVLSPEEFDPALRREGTDFRPLMGATRMLQEGRYQFDILDSQMDLTAYKVLVLPDKIPVDEVLKAKLDAYLAQGGALLATYASGMDAAQERFTLDALGVSLASEGPRDDQGELARGRLFEKNDFTDYVVPREGFDAGLLPTEHAMYMRGMDFAAGEDAVVLADRVASYFDRSWRHFCSHRQTPSSGEVAGPAAVARGRCVYFGHPLFMLYQEKGPRWCKQLVFNALDRLLPERLVTMDAPSAALATLNDQAASKRLVLHLLYYVPERRCEEYDVIEDVTPLYDVDVTVRPGREIAAVRLAPQGDAIPFGQTDGVVSFTVNKITGHQMVELA